MAMLSLLELEALGWRGEICSVVCHLNQRCAATRRSVCAASAYAAHVQTKSERCIRPETEVVI
jgi:hypothetical protein